ncbi:MAG: hypothetical protein Q9207_003333 [Kuettlingeria erythrocarpa]
MPPKKPPKQAKPRQIWLKRMLIPTWVVQILFMLVLITIIAWLSDYNYTGRTVGDVLITSFACANTVVIIAEIILFARRRLRPLLYLIFQVFKTTLWTVLFILNLQSLIRIVSAGYSSGSIATILLTGFIEVLIVLLISDTSAKAFKVQIVLTFIATLIYASVIYHRHRHNRPYHRSRPNSSKSGLSSDVDRYKGPSTDTELGVIRIPAPSVDRYSSCAPEVDAAGGGRGKRLVGELGSGAEIKEMDARPPSYDKGLGMPDGGPRELPENGWIHELSASGSFRGNRKATGELEAGMAPKVPQK